MISHITNDYRAAIAAAATVAEDTRAATEHMERTHLEHHPNGAPGFNPRTYLIEGTMGVPQLRKERIPLPTIDCNELAEEAEEARSKLCKLQAEANIARARLEGAELMDLSMLPILMEHLRLLKSMGMVHRHHMQDVGEMCVYRASNAGWREILDAFEKEHGFDEQHWPEWQRHSHNIVPRLLRFATHLSKQCAAEMKVPNIDDVLAVEETDGSAWAYRALGVPFGAGDDVLKRAFKRCSLRIHPDRNPANQERATAAFKMLNRAYHVVTGDEEEVKLPEPVAQPTQPVRVPTLTSDITAWVANAQCAKELQALWDVEPALSPLQRAILRTVVRVERLVFGDNPQDSDHGAAASPTGTSSRSTAASAGCGATPSAWCPFRSSGSRTASTPFSSASRPRRTARWSGRSTSST